MAIEIVSFPIKNGDFPVRYVNVYQAGYGHFTGNWCGPLRWTSQALRGELRLPIESRVAW